MTVDEFLTQWHDGSPTMAVHTSGSTGQPKTIMVEKRRMEASARMTCRFLGLHEGDTALLCMPLDYIAGKMMVVRALTCGLRLVSTEPASHPLAALDEQCHIDFAAMVPLQVYNSLQNDKERERLKSIKHLIIGGGAIDDTLVRELSDFPNNIWSTYGMTETLSHIALRRLNGSKASEWYTTMEGVRVSLADDNCLVIDAPHVCPQTLKTNDIAVIDDSGTDSCDGSNAPQRFKITGRKDNVVCSGGIKIQIEEVERELRPHLSAPFCITKCKDAALGEALVILTQDNDTQKVGDICRQVLPQYHNPRHCFHIGSIPMTETKKTARAEAREYAEAQAGMLILHKTLEENI